MIFKKIPTLVFLLLIFLVKAQNEFITVWKPSLPPPSYPYAGIPVNSNTNQIWFPGRGTNFKIHWEEIGYPSHNATLNVTSAYQTLIDFGVPHNPNPSDATYRLKVSNGNGNFHQIRFADWDMFNDNGIVGDVHKIQLIEQWGNIQWSSMEQAFQACKILDFTATDVPDLKEVTDMSHMFLGCYSLVGNSSINTWNTSNVTTLLGTFSGCFVFNQPVGDWNTSNVTMMGITFSAAKLFNQPLANWDTSKVTATAAMFSGATQFNQPIGNWDMSSNLDAEFMFSNAINFNQPLGSWNTSQIIEMNHMFNGAKTFNQDLSQWDTGSATIMSGMFNNAENFNSNISNWDTRKVQWMQDMFNGAKKFNQNIGKWNVALVKNMNNMFSNAILFNQNLGSWKLSSLLNASNMFKNSALNCQNYDSTLYGWSLNPSTPNNINLSSVLPLTYSHNAAVTARNYLINNKGWTISGDTYNAECQSFLGTSDVKVKGELSIYPNPATDIIYVKNSNGKDFKIIDVSGRIVSSGNLVNEQINIQPLVPGNYILQLSSKEDIQNLKFIKK
ncbi:Por secretion system C-terminal sorting domain-containing protein [Chryseobacterium rhizoplanae]|uniref:Por secretion system C-terminal sorting domain-containing protein n=1 Tax=Chryseobacterium rhizoplanae TaxID=1609531 RepID=A0A521DYT1_9FLAO|nr:BspA family leucine-rich repeat surface protein [Chryseobacterium rhizoplanae]SMO76040.1 Por secretion system C-terminal sorting domain-containing protein [Chryseobacterium rhizoplanae]